MFAKNAYCILFIFLIEYLSNADMVELADTSDLGSDALGVQVQVLLSAPFKNRWKQRFFLFVNYHPEFLTLRIFKRKTLMFF